MGNKLKKCISKYFAPGKIGLIPDYASQADYYQSLIDWKTANGSSQTTASQPNTFATTTAAGTYVTNSTISSGFSGSWDSWTKAEKKALAKVGFTYDKKTNEWVLDLTTTIRIPQLEGFAVLSAGAGDKPTDQMIALIKQAKEQLIEKLTAKIVLAELIRPREIKDES